MKRTPGIRSWGHVAIAVLMATAGWGVWARPAWANGLPASDAPPTVSGQVQVSTAVQLEYIDQNQSDYVGANIKLMNNLDLTGYPWIPFGGNASAPYSGTFDGQGYAIMNVSITDTTDSSVGFFGETTGRIENVGVSGSVTATCYMGYNGVLVGYLDAGQIFNSDATGSVSGNANDSSSGGLVGNAGNGSTIQASYAAATVSGGGYAGGLVGVASAGGSIADSYAIGRVSGSGGSMGGLAGASIGSSITNSYAIGPVTGGGSMGGLVGAACAGGSITDSDWDTQTTGLSSAVGYNASNLTTLTGVSAEATPGALAASLANAMNGGQTPFNTIWGRANSL